MGFFDRVVNIFKAQVNSAVKGTGAVRTTMETGKDMMVKSVAQPVKRPEENLPNKPADVQRNENCTKLLEYQDRMGKLLGEKAYIAKSDYRDLVQEYSTVIDFFDVLEDSGMLNVFCAKNRVTE